MTPSEGSGRGYQHVICKQRRECESRVKRKRKEKVPTSGKDEAPQKKKLFAVKNLKYRQADDNITSEYSQTWAILCTRTKSKYMQLIKKTGKAGCNHCSAKMG